METITGPNLRISQALFFSLGFLCILAAMLPLGLEADAPVMPNLVFALAFAWTIRRPASAPWGTIFVLGLLADILLMKPIGLWAFLTLMMSEFARAQRWPIREQMFVIEWAIFAAVFAVALGANALLLMVAFETRPPFSLALAYFLSTVLAYPALVAVIHWVFGIRSPRVAHQSKRLSRIS